MMVLAWYTHWTYHSGLNLPNQQQRATTMFYQSALLIKQSALLTTTFHEMHNFFFLHVHSNQYLWRRFYGGRQTACTKQIIHIHASTTHCVDSNTHVYKRTTKRHFSNIPCPCVCKAHPLFSSSPAAQKSPVLCHPPPPPPPLYLSYFSMNCLTSKCRTRVFLTPRANEDKRYQGRGGKTAGILYHYHNN